MSGPKPSCFNYKGCRGSCNVACAVSIIVALAALVNYSAAAAVSADGSTPARGWNSWNTFRCNINETLIKQVADAMVSSGLRDAGYTYINMDDCWMESRDPNGVLQPFQSKFPSGIKALADYVHSRGLKLGLYSDAGNHTCEGHPGSWGHEVQDAKTFAEWGIDYLKYDYCGMPQDRAAVETAYRAMSIALASTGRHIMFSMCSWGSGQPWEWAQGVANSWRVSPDLFAVWDKEQAKALHLPGFLISVMEVVEVMVDKRNAAQPGSFNDADMLVVGLDGMYPYGTPQGGCPVHLPDCKPDQYISREQWGSVGGLTFTQQRSHFSLWVMLASPLLLGNDPRLLRNSVREMLVSPEVLAVHSDPLGKQAVRIFSQGPLQLWRKELKGSGKLALLVLNVGTRSIHTTDVHFAEHFPDLHNMWSRNFTRNFTGQLSSSACEDEHELCSEWAAAGECESNPGYMLWKCKKSCPGACNSQERLLLSQAQSSALVRDAWAREDLGLAVARLQVKHLEPYEGRLFVLQFVDPMGLGGSTGGLASLVSGGVSGTAAYTAAGGTTSARRSELTEALMQPRMDNSSKQQVISISTPKVSGSTHTTSDSLNKQQACEIQLTHVTSKVQQLTDTIAQLRQQLRTTSQAAAEGHLTHAPIPSREASPGLASHNAPPLNTAPARSRTGGDRSTDTGATAVVPNVPEPQIPADNKQGSRPFVAGSFAMNFCMLCLGVVLGVAGNKNRWFRQAIGRGRSIQQHHNPMKLY